MKRILPLLLVALACRPESKPTLDRAALRRIVFSEAPANRGSNIYTMGADGSHRRQVTHFASAAIDEPAFSPNGKKIVFARNARVGLASDVYTANANGSGLRRVTRAPDLAAGNPDWGPRG